MTEVVDLPIFDRRSTLFEAILGMGALRKNNPSSGFRYPGVLVSDEERRIAGFVDFRNLLKGLEPGYFELAESVKGNGMPTGWVRSELERHGLHTNALDELCRKTGGIEIGELMSTPDPREVTEADAPVDEVIYRMVVTGKDFLFVRSGGALVGIINISDVLAYMYEVVKHCRV